MLSVNVVFGIDVLGHKHNKANMRSYAGLASMPPKQN